MSGGNIKDIKDRFVTCAANNAIMSTDEVKMIKRLKIFEEGLQEFLEDEEEKETYKGLVNYAEKQKRFDLRKVQTEAIKEEDELESADEFIKLHRGEKVDIKPRKNHNVRVVNCCKNIKNRATTILRTDGKEYTINGK